MFTGDVTMVTKLDVVNGKLDAKTGTVKIQDGIIVEQSGYFPPATSFDQWYASLTEEQKREICLKEWNGPDREDSW